MVIIAKVNDKLEKIYLLQRCAHTNPSRSQSKGREASRGIELYFVVKALDLELNMKWLSAMYNNMQYEP